MNFDGIGPRLGEILESLGKQVSGTVEGARHQVHLWSNDAYPLQASLSFLRSADSDEVAVTVSVLRKDGELHFASEIVRDDGQILAEGPAMVTNELVSIERTDRWISEFEEFAGANQSLLLKELALIEVWTADAAELSRSRQCISQMIDLQSPGDVPLAVPPFRPIAAMDFGRITSETFFEVVKCLGSGSGERIRMLVLDPDPIEYFQHHFGRFPLVTVHRNGGARVFLDALNWAPPDSPADSIASNGNSVVLFQESCTWMIFCHYESELAILYADPVTNFLQCIPPEWLYNHERIRKELVAGGQSRADEFLAQMLQENVADGQNDSQ